MIFLRHLESVEEVPGRREKIPCALALGTFDGLHLGHMAVLEAALKTALPGGAGVVTFEASPSGCSLLMTGEEKEERFREMGMKELYSFEFSRVKDLPAEEFAESLLFEKCHAMALCCGEDFRFGKGAQGDTALLKKLCARRGAELIVTPARQEGGEKISSTRIRAAVEQGDISLANRLLGRPFGYRLEVIHGNHIGTGLGFPTINQAYPGELVSPPFGVYASLAEVEGKKYAGVTNIGVKPTVGSDRALSETWMPAFSGDLYGRKIRVSLLEFLRPERKFSSLDELKEEVQKNAVQASEIAEKNAKSEIFPETVGK